MLLLTRLLTSYSYLKQKETVTIVVVSYPVTIQFLLPLEVEFALAVISTSLFRKMEMINSCSLHLYGSDGSFAINHEVWDKN